MGGARERRGRGPGAAGAGFGGRARERLLGSAFPRDQPPGAMAAVGRGKAETLALRRRLLRYRDGGAGRCAHARRTHVRRGAQERQPRAWSALQLPGPLAPAAASRTASSPSCPYRGLCPAVGSLCPWEEASALAPGRPPPGLAGPRDLPGLPGPGLRVTREGAESSDEGRAWGGERVAQEALEKDYP